MPESSEEYTLECGCILKIDMWATCDDLLGDDIGVSEAKIIKYCTSHAPPDCYYAVGCFAWTGKSQPIDADLFGVIVPEDATNQQIAEELRKDVETYFTGLGPNTKVPEDIELYQVWKFPDVKERN